MEENNKTKVKVMIDGVAHVVDIKDCRLITDDEAKQIQLQAASKVDYSDIQQQLKAERDNYGYRL